jgi:hypothetical protein
MPKKWFLLRNEKQLGPYTWSQLVHQYRDGKLKRHDHLFDPVSGAFITAEHVRGLIPRHDSQTNAKYSNGFLASEKERKFFIIMLSLVVFFVISTVVFVIIWKNCYCVPDSPKKPVIEKSLPTGT